MARKPEDRKRPVEVAKPRRQAQPVAPLRAALAFSWGGRGGGTSISTIAMTGLTSGVAEIGTHASISVGFPSGVTSWTSQSWGASLGATTYGTGANPTTFAAGNGGSLQWQGVGDDGETYRATAPIRYPVPVLAALTNQTINSDDVEPTYDISGEVTFLGTASYSLTVVPAEGGVSINSSGVIAFDTETLALQAGTTITVRVADAVDATRFDEASFTLTVEETTTIVLTKVSEDFSTSSPEIEIAYSSGAAETLYWEADESPAQPVRGAGSFGSGTAGTLGSPAPLDLSAFELETLYVHISAGPPSASNTLTYGPFEVPEVGGSEFPSTDTAAVFWIDPSDAATITATGNDLTSIADKVAAATFTPSGDVDTGLATINSLNVLSMVGGRLESPSADLTGDIALHMVCNIGTVNNLSDAAFLIRSTDSTSSSTGQFVRFFANFASAFNGRVNMRNASAGSRSVTPSGGPFSGIYLISMVWDNEAGNAMTLFVNNTSVFTENRSEYADGVTATSFLHLFGDWAQNLGGTLGEVILTKDITNRAAYTTYLADKWGITL
jgi:hypothetical protein